MVTTVKNGDNSDNGDKGDNRDNGDISDNSDNGDTRTKRAALLQRFRMNAKGLATVVANFGGFALQWKAV